MCGRVSEIDNLLKITITEKIEETSTIGSYNVPKKTNHLIQHSYLRS